MAHSLLGYTMLRHAAVKTMDVSPVVAACLATLLQPNGIYA